MAHSERRADATTKSTKRDLPETDFLKIYTQSPEALVKVQKQFVDTFERLNREQLDRARQETELATELAGKLTSARSIPDVMTAYQEWITRRMGMFAEDGRKFFDESQKIANATVRALSNGGGGGST